MHGTCYNTLRTAFLPSQSPQGAGAFAFFQQVVGLFQTSRACLPTRGLDHKASLTTRMHSLSGITDALKAASGVCCILLSSIVELVVVVSDHSILRPFRALATRSPGSAGILTSETDGDFIHICERNGPQRVRLCAHP
jgi:hypothetical protein